MSLSSIRNQLLLFFCVLAVVPIVILGILISHHTETVLKERVSREMRVEVSASAETLETYLAGVSRDLLFLSRFLGRRLSPEMNETRWREVEDEFYLALHAERSYYQIRFIGTDGWEKLRINNLDGHLVRVSPREYQFKGDRYYVREALRMPVGEIYLSPLDFNVEHGRLEEPRRLVTRMATTVQGPEGRIQGVVVINMFGSDLLRMVETVQPIAESRLFLVGESGDYVERVRLGAKWEILTREADTLAVQLGFPADDLLREPGDQVKMEGSTFLATAPVQAGDSTWYLVKTFPRSLLYQDLNRIKNAILITALILLLSAIGLAVLATRRFSRPIGKLVRFADMIAGGAYDQKVSHAARDEFGTLATALNRMAGALADSHQRLLQWNRKLQEEVSRRTQELSISEEKYRLIFSAVSNAILIIDAETRRIEEVNHAACLLYGYDREELIGMNALALSAEPEKSLQRAEEVLSGRRHIDLSFHRRKDGSVIPVSISAGVFEWQKKKLVVGIMKDVSERQRLEKLKDEMLAGIGHEMRTPLTAVIGFLELLLENGIDLKQRREYLQTCLQESERLHSLIENLLALQRLRTKERLVLKSVDVCTLLKQEESAFVSGHGENRLRIECADNLPPIEADPEMLHQAIANLIDNAQRYSPPGTEIVLSSALEGNAIVIKVKDRGPGIPYVLQEEIFDRFFRIDSRDGRRIGGTGLGLLLVKEIANVHGGKVRLESQQGEGSTFCIIIPVESVDRIIRRHGGKIWAGSDGPGR